jgi:hypothetical protein
MGGRKSLGGTCRPKSIGFKKLENRYVQLRQVYIAVLCFVVIISFSLLHLNNPDYCELQSDANIVQISHVCNGRITRLGVC